MNIQNYWTIPVAKYRSVSARRSAGGIDSRMVESRLAMKDSTFDKSKVNVSSSILMKFLYNVRSLANISGISWVYAPCKYLQIHFTDNKLHIARGGSKGGGGGALPPSKKSLPFATPMKFMIKHNLPVVGVVSRWQYRSMPPSCNDGHPTPPKM